MPAQRPPLSVIIIYALGQLGWSLAAFGGSNLLIYFYMPPEEADGVVFPPYIFQGTVLGIFTIIGLITAGGRVFDAFTDPMIANWSDRLKSSFGKRKLPMAIAFIPFALFSFLIFYPPSTTDIQLNSIWLIGSVFIFFLSMTIYVVPYTALIPELGHHPDDRMKISTIISVAWAIGFLIGNSCYTLQSVLEIDGYTSTEAFHATILIFAGIAALFMLIPILFLNEKKYCQQGESGYSIMNAIKSVFNNRNFLYFSLSDFMYWLALTFIQIGNSYYITILMGLDKSYATLFMNIGFLCSFLFYVPINYLVKRFGKRQLMIVAFLSFCITFGITFAIKWIPIPIMVIFYSLAILSALPLAIFGIIPNAIIADIAHEQEEKTGANQSGMFYAARNFMMKMGITFANLIFPSLLLLGKSVDEPLGVQLSTLCALVFCIMGYALFTQYKEVEVVATD